MTTFGICLRCGRAALEHLVTHSYCWECNYSPNTDPDLAQWHAIEFRSRKRQGSQSREAKESRWSIRRSLHGIGYGGLV